jgi:hypothetical protein
MYLQGSYVSDRHRAARVVKVVERGLTMYPQLLSPLLHTATFFEAHQLRLLKLRPGTESVRLEVLSFGRIYLLTPALGLLGAHAEFVVS